MTDSRDDFWTNDHEPTVDELIEQLGGRAGTRPAATLPAVPAEFLELLNRIMDGSPRGRPHNWILNPDHTVRPVENILEWAKCFEDRDQRRVAETTVHGPLGKQWVSTVFLGIDHSWSMTGPPILFETMIFGGPLDQEWQDRYETWDQAVAGHAAAVEVARRQRWNLWGYAKAYASQLVRTWRWRLLPELKKYAAFVKESVKEVE